MKGVSQLLKCLERGDAEGVKKACPTKAEANVKLEGMPILQAVALRGLPEMVDALIDAGADVNARDNSGMTALMYVSFLGYDPKHHQILDRLIAAGADINATVQPSGRTAIDMAAQILNGESVRRLQAAGAKPTTAMSRQWVRDALSKSPQQGEIDRH